MPIPLLDLKAQYRQIRQDVEAVLLKTAEEQLFILGPEVQRLEHSIAEYVGSEHAIGVSSGTDALLLSLMALGIGPGDGVILPTFSFFATAGVVSRLHATPVFVDIDPVTYNIDPAAMARAYEKYNGTLNIKAIIPVHLFGQSADMHAIMSFASAHGLHVIEDAAQAIGTAYRDGRRVGSIGTAGCFSFFPSKNLGAFGDGGIITTNDDELAQRMRLMRVHGAERYYYHEMIGGNFRLDALQAAVLNIKLPYLDSWHEGRRRNAARYNELLATLPDVLTPVVVYEDERVEAGIENATGVGEDGALRFAHIYNQYCVRVPDRDAVMKRFAERSIGCAVYYPVPFHAQKCFTGIPSCGDAFPVADDVCRDILALPVYPEMTTEMQDVVVAALA